MKTKMHIDQQCHVKENFLKILKNEVKLWHVLQILDKFAKIQKKKKKKP